MKSIPIRGRNGYGKIALVDDDMYDFLASSKWHYNDGYARCALKQPDGSYKRFSMHRLVIKVEPHELVDHIDGNMLNNQRANLRSANRQNNRYNMALRKDSTTGYKGVHWSKSKAKYEVYISKDGKRFTIGTTTDKEEGAYLYDQFALALFGEYARFNVIDS